MEESRSTKCKLLASEGIRVATANCSASHLGNEVQELAAASCWEAGVYATLLQQGGFHR